MPRSSENGWTVGTLKEYFESLFEQSALRHQQRFDAQEKAVQDALAAAEKAEKAKPN